MRISLETDPALRYATALDLAQAISAGVEGEYTDVTMRLATAELQATRAIQPTEGTRVMARQPVAPQTMAPSTPPPKKKNCGGRILAGIAVLAAGAVVALALLQASNPGVVEIAAGKFRQQVQQLESYIRDHTQ